MSTALSILNRYFPVTSMPVFGYHVESTLLLIATVNDLAL